MSVMLLVAGNSMIKAKTGRREQNETAFPHAIKQLTEAQYANILARAGTMGLPRDYLRVNGMLSVVVESAVRYGGTIQCTGAARYTCDC